MSAKRMEEGAEGRFEYMELDPSAQKQKAELLSKKVKQIIVDKNTTVADLVENMGEMSIQARNIGQCAKVLKNLYADPDRPTVFLGLAGPLIAAGLRNVIKDLVVNNAVDVVVSTGAIIFQDIYAARGHGHYIGTPDADDNVLNDLRIDRIYDTYTDEVKFWQTDFWCGWVAEQMEPGNYSSREYLENVANYLEDEESILYQCRKHKIPVFVPALNDSSIGIGLTDYRIRAKRKGKAVVAIDSIQDNEEILQIVLKSKKTAAIYVAGGVPKNYINDSIVMAYTHGREKGHDYAIQMTTAVTQDGGLSGSTLSEARSWGKIEHKAQFAMAWVEPSVALPLVAGYVFGKELTKDRTRLKFEWKKGALLGI